MERIDPRTTMGCWVKGAGVTRVKWVTLAGIRVVQDSGKGERVDVHREGVRRW